MLTLIQTAYRRNHKSDWYVWPSSVDQRDTVVRFTAPR